VGLSNGRCGFTLGPRAASSNRRALTREEVRTRTVFNRRCSEEEIREGRVLISSFYSDADMQWWECRLSEMRAIDIMPRAERTHAILLFYHGTKVAANHALSMNAITGLGDQLSSGVTEILAAVRSAIVPTVVQAVAQVEQTVVEAVVKAVVKAL
jgi:predicted GTPase